MMDQVCDHDEVLAVSRLASSRARVCWRSVFYALVLFTFAGPLTAFAHLDDEARQAFATIKIEEGHVEVIATIPARFAFPVLLDGMSPVELDKLEPDAMAQRIAPILVERNPVTIDGVPVRPTIHAAQTRMMNSRLPPRMFPEPQVMQYGELVVASRYAVKSPPRRVSLTWDVFIPEYDEFGEPVSDGSTSPVASVLKVDGKQQLVVLTEDEPGHTWHSDERVAVPASLTVSSETSRPRQMLPLLSIGLLLAGLLSAAAVKRVPMRLACVGLGLVLGGVALTLPVGRVAVPMGVATVDQPSEGEAIELFRSLHGNIYRAFDYTDESAVYDALAMSVDGPMLESIYNDVYQSLILREEGGAVCKIERVDLASARVLDPDNRADEAIDEPGAYRVRASWTVDGLVQHFGHTHRRTNAFEAIYTVAPRAGSWRIVDAQILDQRRTDDGKQTLSGSPG